jgi:cytochrome b561
VERRWEGWPRVGRTTLQGARMTVHQFRAAYRDPDGGATPARPRRFDAVTIGLHWTTVGLIVGMFATALMHEQAQGGAWAGPLLETHRSFGVTLWVVAVCRLAWRLRFAFLPPFPAGMSEVQQTAAKATEYGLYALLLGQPLTGLAQSLTLGRPFPMFGWETPAVMGRNKDLTSLFHGIHELSAWALLGLISLHVLAALFHRLALRDDVLQSMLPWKATKRPPALRAPEDDPSAPGELTLKGAG